MGITVRTMMGRSRSLCYFVNVLEVFSSLASDSFIAHDSCHAWTKITTSQKMRFARKKLHLHRNVLSLYKDVIIFVELKMDHFGILFHLALSYLYLVTPYWGTRNNIIKTQKLADELVQFIM